MSEVITGVIDSIFTKTVNTKFGAKEVYHATINGHDVNLGFKTECVEGQQVTLNVEHKYGGYQLLQGAVTGTPTQVGAAPPPGSSPTPAAAPRAVSAAFPIAVNAREMSIVRQSSLTRAVESVNQLMDKGLIVISNEADYQEKVMEFAYFYTDFGTGQREVKAAAAQAAYAAQSESVAA